MTADHATAAGAAIAPPVLPSRDGSITLARLADLYFQQYEGRDRSTQQRMAWWIERIGTKRLDELTDDDVAEGMDALARRQVRNYKGRDADGRAILKPVKRTLSGGTIVRYVSILSAVFTFAIKKRIAPRGFVHPVRLVEKPRESPGRVRFLSDDERTRLLAACRESKAPRLYLLVLLALTTGARRGELLGARWGDIDWERKTMRVERTKNNEPRVLPLTGAVLAEMERFKGAPTALLFAAPRKPGRAFDHVPSWHEAMRVAGIKGFVFHCLRHSAATHLAMSGASLLEIADVLGHKTLTMVQRYAHNTVDRRAELIERVMGGMR